MSEQLKPTNQFTESIGDSIRSYLEKQELSLDAIKTEDEVESIAMEVLDQEPTARILLEQIKKSRQLGREDEIAVRERSQMFNKLKVEIALISGVEIDAVKHNQEKQEYKNKIRETLAGLDPTISHEQLMEKLGIVRPVEGRRGYVFEFPYHLFPPYVEEQWEVYMEMVNQFEAAVNKLNKGVVSQQEFSGIDLMRRRAHNTVSQSIGEILEFENWELEDYRSFVAKMRDKKYNDNMGEINRYGSDFRTNFMNQDEHLSLIQQTIRDFR